MHDAEHERWLEELASREPGAATREPRAATRDVEERLARCADCREAFERFAGVCERVAAAAREREAVLALARTLRDVPGEERAVERLRAVARPVVREGAPRAEPARVVPAARLVQRRVWPRVLPWIAGLAAAAVLATLLVRGLLVEERAPDPGPVLGAPVQLVRPIDRVERYSPFEWDTAPSGGARFELVVEGYYPALARWSEALKRPVEGTSHVLAPEEEARLPARIRWRIRATRPGEPGAAIAEAEASCSR